MQDSCFILPRNVHPTMSTPGINETAVRSYADDFSRHKRSFVLSPTQWKHFKMSTQLQWKQQPLKDSSISLIPESRGVYAHTISADVANLPPTNYVTYVGLVGDKKKVGVAGDKRHLRQRFKEYLKEREKLRRALVWDMLKLYDGFVTFHYAEVSDKTVSLLGIENALLDALLPPCNIEDFSINIKKAHQILSTR